MILLPHLYNCFLSLLAGHGSMVRFLQGCFFKQSNHSRFFSLYLHVRLSCFPNVSSYIRKGIARKVSNRSYRRQCQLLMILSSEKKRYMILDMGNFLFFTSKYIFKLFSFLQSSNFLLGSWYTRSVIHLN
jgi:hypothetical protein